MLVRWRVVQAGRRGRKALDERDGVAGADPGLGALEVGAGHPQVIEDALDHGLPDELLEEEHRRVDEAVADLRPGEGRIQGAGRPLAQMVSRSSMRVAVKSKSLPQVQSPQP